MPQTATFSQEALIAEIEATRRYLAGLENSLLALGGKPRREQHVGATGRYADLKVWKAVRNYLASVKREASLHELARELEEGGCATLGKYPLRTISTAIGKMEGKNVFVADKRDGQTFVSLAEPHITAAAA